MKRARKGFTLIELAIVAAAVAILLGIIVHYARSYTAEAKADKIQNFLREIIQAVQVYQQEKGCLPQDDTYLYKNYLQKRDASTSNGFGGFIPEIVDGDIEPDNSNYRIRIDIAGKSINSRIAKIIDERMDDGNISTGQLIFVSSWGSAGIPAIRYWYVVPSDKYCTSSEY